MTEAKVSFLVCAAKDQPEHSQLARRFQSLDEALACATQAGPFTAPLSVWREEHTRIADVAFEVKPLVERYDG